MAEDEALIRLDLVEMLREEGYDVVGEAGDGEQAVALAKEPGPRPGGARREDARHGRSVRGRGDRRRRRTGLRHAHRLLPGRAWSSGPATRGRWPTW
nr:hypothetical protein [Angustibacter aerolatus]